MKEIQEAKEITQDQEMSLVEQVMNLKPEFATREEAIKAYSERLEAFAQRCGRSVSEMLSKAEHSAEFDEDCDEAMRLFRMISALKRRK